MGRAEQWVEMSHGSCGTMGRDEPYVEMSPGLRQAAGRGKSWGGRGGRSTGYRQCTAQ